MAEAYERTSPILLCDDTGHFTFCCLHVCPFLNLSHLHRSHDVLEIFGQKSKHATVSPGHDWPPSGALDGPTQSVDHGETIPPAEATEPGT